MVCLTKPSPSIHTVDITGGAPELNPHFRMLVQEVSFAGTSNLLHWFGSSLKHVPSGSSNGKDCDRPLQSRSAF